MVVDDEGRAGEKNNISALRTELLTIGNLLRQAYSRIQMPILSNVRIFVTLHPREVVQEYCGTQIVLELRIQIY